MSTRIMADRCKYVLNAADAKKAVSYLKRTYGAKETVRTLDCGNGTKMVYPASAGIFDGEVDNCWCDDVEEFILDWCMPESYATFRCDDLFSWVIIYKDENGNIVIEERDMENPFDELCDNLEMEQKAFEV